MKNLILAFALFYAAQSFALVNMGTMVPNFLNSQTKQSGSKRTFAINPFISFDYNFENLIWNQNTVTGILNRYDLYVRGHNQQSEALWEPIVFLTEGEANRILNSLGREPVSKEEE